MTDKKPDYTPILKPVYNFSTSCTKEEAVQYLLGWIEFPLTITVCLLSDEEIHEEYLKEEETYEPSLYEILEESREALVTDYLNANEDGKSEALAALKECDLVIETTHEYLCLIDDELARGQGAELRTCLDSGHITIISFKEWASGILKTKSNESALQVKNTYDERAKDSKIKTKEANLLVKFGLLIEEYAETSPGLQCGGKPNAAAIARKLVKRAENIKRPMNGVSIRGVTSAISQAEKAITET